MVAAGGPGEQAVSPAGFCFTVEVFIQYRQVDPAERKDHGSQQGDKEKGHVPVVFENINQVEGKCNPYRRSDGEGAHHGAHGGASSLVHKEVADDGEYLTADDSPECSCHDTGNKE